MPGTYRNFIRVFKEHRVGVGTSGIERLERIRFPVEHLFFGIKPLTNNGPTTWWRFHAVNAVNTVYPVRIPPNQLAYNTTTLLQPVPNILTAKFLAKNTEINRDSRVGLLTRVFPFQKAQSGDEGIMFFSFADKISQDEFNGYYNLSQMREFYIRFTAQVPGELYVLAVCLNWVDIGESGAVSLRFN
jgi:hypothetical protein